MGLPSTLATDHLGASSKIDKTQSTPFTSDPEPKRKDFFLSGEKHEEATASYVDLKAETKGFHGQVLSKVEEALKEDSALNVKSSTNLITFANMLREVNIPGVMRLLEDIQTAVNTQRAHHDTLVESYKSLLWNLAPRLRRLKPSFSVTF
ncbi:hypothetical protein Tco_0887789 [Tanacetum coccineum]